MAVVVATCTGDMIPVWIPYARLDNASTSAEWHLQFWTIHTWKKSCILWVRTALLEVLCGCMH